MKQNLIYSELIQIPATTGTKYYRRQITTDKLYPYMTGIACMLVSGAVDGADVEIEIRDDQKSIFSMSSGSNWIKTANNAGWDMQNFFRPCMQKAAGRNIYLNVKATDCDAFNFVFYIRQSVESIACIDYDFQSYDIQSNSNNVISLPANYKYVRGMQIASADGANDRAYQVRIEDARGNLMDDIILDAVKVRSQLLYDRSFYPVSFDGDSRDVRIYITRIDGENADTFNAKICFLVTNSEI